MFSWEEETKDELEKTNFLGHSVLGTHVLLFVGHFPDNFVIESYSRFSIYK